MTWRIDMAKGTRTAKTAEQLLKDVEKAEQKLASLKKRAFAGSLTEKVKSSSIPAQFKQILEGTKGVSDVGLLEVIGEVVGIKRLVVTQTEAKTRAPRKPK
jgi:hypothetical protein